MLTIAVRSRRNCVIFRGFASCCSDNAHHRRLATARFRLFPPSPLFQSSSDWRCPRPCIVVFHRLGTLPPRFDVSLPTRSEPANGGPSAEGA
jgi:hypothetical protein